MPAEQRVGNMKTILLVVASMFATASTAADFDCRGGVRGKGGLVIAGDSTGRVMKALGKPDRYVTLENRFGGAVGERWVYYVTGRNAKTIHIEVSGGQVTSACQKLD